MWTQLMLKHNYSFTLRDLGFRLDFQKRELLLLYHSHRHNKLPHIRQEHSAGSVLVDVAWCLSGPSPKYIPSLQIPEDSALILFPTQSRPLSSSLMFMWVCLPSARWVSSGFTHCRWEHTHHKHTHLWHCVSTSQCGILSHVHFVVLSYNNG